MPATFSSNARGLENGGALFLAGTRKVEAAQRVAVVVDADAMREPRPREGRDLQDVVQELRELERAFAHVPNLVGLLDRRHVHAHLVHAAARGTHHVVEAREVPDEERLGTCGFLVTARVGHGLPAAGLVERIVDLASEALQQFEGGDADLRLESVHVAGNEETDAHRHPPRAGRPGRGHFLHRFQAAASPGWIERSSSRRWGFC
jgi:hypothetical protein